MNAILFAVLAASCGALANLFFRINSSKSPASSNGYLLINYLFSFAFALILYPEVWKGHVNMTILLIGACVGLLNISLMLLTAYALKKGPAGVTFAFQNASSVFPGLILFAVFGEEYGFTTSFLQVAGILMVIAGLYLSTQNGKKEKSENAGLWLKLVLSGFFVQIFALTLIQSRCILFDCNHPKGMLASFAIPEAADCWFMPGQFGFALILQFILFLSEKRKLEKTEAMYGSLAGVMNIISTSLLLLATKLAQPYEKGILFPTFAVTSIILCNAWANWFYEERFNLKANTLCAAGIIIGSTL